MRHPITLFVSGLLAVSALAVSLQAQAPAASPDVKKIKNPVASSPASISAGAATYKKYCAFCHNDDATGDGPMAPKDSHPPDLTDVSKMHGPTDGEIFTTIKMGGGPKSVMKPFGQKIMDQDIWNVVNFLRSLQHPAK